MQERNILKNFLKWLIVQYLYFIHISTRQCWHKVPLLLLAAPFLLPSHEAPLPAPTSGSQSAPGRLNALINCPSQTELSSQSLPFQTEEKLGDTFTSLSERRNDRKLLHNLWIKAPWEVDGALPLPLKEGKWSVLWFYIKVCVPHFLRSTISRYSQGISHTVISQSSDSK